MNKSILYISLLTIIISLYTILFSLFLRIKKSRSIEYSDNIRRMMQANRKRLSPASRIKNNFIDIQTNINNAQESIQKILKEIECQFELFNKEKDRFEQIKQISSIQENQYVAFEKSLIHIVEQQSEKNNKLNLKWGIIFCILSAILGNLLPPISRIFSFIFS
ncbi:hypothetical protein J5W03_11950 [Akkermansia muciniphila]|nr:hypothetical protein [Akkermansia muciniphila]